MNATELPRPGKDTPFAAVRILCGPDGHVLTTALLAHILPLCRRDPGSVLWIAPTRHAAAALCHRMLDRVGTVVGVRITTFPQLVDAILEEEPAPVPTVPAGQRRLIVEEVVSDLLARGELLHFQRVAETGGFADRLLGLIDELEQAGVAPDAVPPAGVGDVKGREWARLFARYRDELRRLGWHDERSREMTAARGLAAGQPPLLDGVATVVLAGFSDFTPAQMALLAGLAARVRAVHVGLLDEAKDERGELFTRPRGTRQELQRLFPALSVQYLTEADDAPRPAGMNHLAAQLFLPLRRVLPSDDAAGLEFIEAPGLVGEVRLLARRVKRRLLAGVHADAIDLVVRDLNRYADLIRETFAEYGIPVEVEGGDPLDRQPAVAVLLRALHLPLDDFPFAGVTALLRHGSFRPRWPEVEHSPDLPLEAEALLRLLAEPRGRQAYLAAVDRWAQEVQPGLEDEEADAGRRRRTHDLARRCRAFLHRFFACWDGMPGNGSVSDYLKWLETFSAALGFTDSAAADPADQAAWQTLWAELEAWRRRDEQTGEQPLDARTFLRRLGALARAVTLPRTPAGPGRVRVVSAGQARHLGVRERFVVGLGERSFPRCGGTLSLFDDADRETLRSAGVPLAGSDELADEMLLFYQVVTGARDRLTLSYPAVDDRGQELLPSSFLSAVRHCFTAEAVPVERRRMLLEPFDSGEPLSDAEYRVQAAARWPHGADQLAPDVRANLDDAAAMLRQRFDPTGFTPFDGLFSDPNNQESAGRLFGADHVFSPTALEDYVACPFRFFLRHVLGLEPLDEPTEEIEVTRRGMTYHRALARLHRRLRAEEVHAPTAAVAEAIAAEMRAAVAEDVRRAPGPAAQELWRLEGERLLRTAARYPAHWAGFVDPWHQRGLTPRPHLFEVDFGLPGAAHGPLTVEAEGVTVRLWGRIDRIDIAECGDDLGFWVIDYKTGRASGYTATEVNDFRKLQLALYALAVEGVLLADRRARPLGLAYWLVTDTGAKVVLPGRNVTGWLDARDGWPPIRQQLVAWVTRLVRHIRAGAFPLAPRSEQCTLTCPYSQSCRINQTRIVGKLWDLPLPTRPERTS